MKEAIELRGRRGTACSAALRTPRRPRISIAAVISPVYIHASLFVWRACVVLFCVARVCCALLSAASARPGSAPAGKPPAKRLGKHRASRPSDSNDIVKKSTLISEACSLLKKLFLIRKEALRPISRPRARCKDAASPILSFVAAL